jgi:hypothetical protein
MRGFDMKVLFVAFEFPPLGGGGVQRSMKFATYLADSGVTPIVITTDPLNDFKESIADTKLLDELPSDLVVERIPCPPPTFRPKARLAAWLRIFCSIVEPHGRWWRHNLEKQLPRIIKTYEPQVIYVSLPPFAMAPLWLAYAEKYGIPIVFDFRDAWSQWQAAPYPTWIHYRLTRALEKKCLLAAARVICTSEQTRQDLLSVHPEVHASKIVTITNGFDAEISDWSPSSIKPERTGKFVIGYVGNFYYSPEAREAVFRPWWRKKPHRMLQYTSRKEDWLYRSPFFFFRSMRRLLESNPSLRQRVLIRFAGLEPEWFRDQVVSSGLDDVVEHLGYLDYPSVLEFENECDCLLITSAKVLGGADYSIAGKTFEYLSMRRPILAFVTEGAQKEILLKSGMAVICDPDDVEGATSRLSDLIHGRISLRPNEPFLRGLHRRELTASLAQVLKAAQT